MTPGGFFRFQASGHVYESTACTACTAYTTASQRLQLLAEDGRGLTVH
jgi:hypothetical protein